MSRQAPRGRACGPDYLLKGLRAFLAYRETTTVVLTRLGARLEREAGVRAVVVSRGAVSAIGLACRRGAAIARTAVAVISVLPAVRREARRLARARAEGTRSYEVLLALAARRLAPAEMETSLPAFLLELAQDFGECPDDTETVRHEIATADRIIVLDPGMISPLRRRPSQECRGPTTFVIDGAHLVYVAVRSAPRIVRALWRHARNPGVRETLARRPSLWKPLGAAVVLAEVYRELLPIPSRALFFTTNSFATEILRMYLLQAPVCVAMTELQHGVPPVWEEIYFRELLAMAAADGNPDKHLFVPQVPGHPFLGVFERHRRFRSQTGVNAYLTKYLVDHGFRRGQSRRFVEREWTRLFPEGPPPDDTTIVAFFGTIAGADEFRAASMRDGNVGVERFIIECIAATMTQMRRPYVLVYTPHPLSPLAVVREQPFLSASKVVVHDSTPATWFLADMCVSLYSSTVFEARYFGLDTFTPIAPADGIYHLDQIALLKHPGQHEGLGPAVRAFVKAYQRGATPDRLLRAEQRLALTESWARVDAPNLQVSRS